MDSALFKTKRAKSKVELGKLYEALSELRAAWETIAGKEQGVANLAIDQTP